MADVDNLFRQLDKDIDYLIGTSPDGFAADGFAADEGVVVRLGKTFLALRTEFEQLQKRASTYSTELAMLRKEHREYKRLCSLCGTEIAVYPCTHALVTALQVTMSRQEWERMTEELNRLRASHEEE